MAEAETASTARHTSEQDVSIARRAMPGPALVTCSWPRIQAEVRLDVRVVTIAGPSSVRAARIASVLDSWERGDGYHLTVAEREVLLLATEGLTVLQIAEVRGTAVETVLKQSKALLLKTFDDSLPAAAIRLLGEAAGLP